MATSRVLVLFHTSWRHRFLEAIEVALGHPRATRYLTALGIYVGITIWVTGIPGHDIVHHMLNNGNDPPLQVFFLKWWPWAILHGQNAFEFRQLTWPATYNTAWVTSLPGPALLGAPLTLLLGPLATWNLWHLVAPVSASMAMLVLLDTLEVPAVTAIAGGFIFGFSSFVMGEMEGHLFMMLVFPLPLLATLLVRRVRDQIKPAWFIALSVLLASFLLYTSIELFVTATLAAVFGCLLLLIWYPKPFIETASKLGGDLIGVVAGITLLGAPLLGYALANVGIGNSAIHPLSLNSIDLLNFVIPTREALLGGNLAAPIVHYSGTPPEQGGYIGALLAVICIFAIVQGLRKRRWVAPFAIWTVLLGVCAFGPQLYINGKSAGIPLPWGLVSNIPVLKEALPSRLMVYVSLAVATWSALWTSWAPSKRQRLGRNVALIAGALLLLPNPASFPWLPPAVPAAASDGQLAAWVPPHTGLLLLWPGSTRAGGALWSEAADFQLDVSEAPWGYDRFRPSYKAWPLWTFANQPIPPPGAAQQVEAFSATHDDGAIAVPDSAPAWVDAFNDVGWPHRHLPGTTVYRVPEAVLAEYRHATPGQLHLAFYHTEVEALERAGACYLRRGGRIAALDPRTAVARHCLSPAYLGQSPSTNWTVDNGWLGPQDGQVGVGIAGTGKVAAKVFAGTPLPRKWLLYDPKAKRVRAATMRHGPSGTYMAVGPFTTKPARSSHG